MHKTLFIKARKVIVSLIALTAVVFTPVIPSNTQEARALASAPGNTGCDTFTQDVDYVLGNPPPVSIWTPSFGNWVIATDTAEDVLHQTDVTASNPNDAVNLLTAPGALNDILFSADIKPLSGTNDVGIVFRASDHDNFYLFRADGFAGTAGLFKRVNGTYSLLAPEVPYAITTGTEYQFHIVMVGTSMRAYINNILVLTATDATFDSGFVGLRTNASTAYFDNACVAVGPFTWDVDDNGVECPLPDFTSIQEAIDFVGVGDTVHVCAGTYEEQLVINKQIKISGDGVTSIVKLPIARPSDPLKTITIAGSMREADPLIWIESAKDATVEKLFIDGSNNNDISGWRSTVGIVIKDGSAAIQNNTITNFNGPACWGCSTGYGVWVEGTTAAATIKDNILSNIQADSITIQSGKANVMNNTVTGLDLGSYDGQLGISYEQGTSGIILNNTLSGFNHPGAEVSTAISMVNAATGMTLSGNKLSGNEQAIVVQGTNGGKMVSTEITGSKSVDALFQNASNWIIAQNKLNGSLGKGFVFNNTTNIQASINTITGTALEGIVLQATAGGTSSKNIFVQNTISTSGSDGILLSMDGSAGAIMDSNSFTSNTIKDGLGNGVNIEATGTNRVSKPTFKANKITNNKLSGFNLRKINSGIVEVNTITGNKHHGILLANLMNGSSVAKNTITGNKRNGISLQGNSDNNKFTLNTAKTNGVPGFFDLYWDSDASATGNAPSMNFYTTKQPPLFWK